MTHKEPTMGEILGPMTDEEKLEWLLKEEEALIASADPKNVLGLRLTQARMKALRQRYKNPEVCLAVMGAEMVESLNKLNEALRGFPL